MNKRNAFGRERIVSDINDPGLDGLNVKFSIDINAVSRVENEILPRVTISKGTSGILTGGEIKKIVGQKLRIYLVVEVTLYHGGIKSIHLVITPLEYLKFDRN